MNETRWGKCLAEYVRDNLPNYGLPTEDILCEDWGWLVYVHNEDFPLWIGCGPMEDFVDEPPKADDLIEFSLFVTAEPKLLQRMFKKVDTKPAIHRVVTALRAMIVASDQFEDPEWSDS